MDGVTTTGAQRRALLERMVAEQPHRLVRKMRAAGHSGADAEDLAQETLLRALRGIDGVRGPAEEALVCGWVDRIAGNVSLNHRRDAARRPTAPLPPEDHSPRLGVEVPGDADVIACRRSLEPLLATLPEAQRVVFVARVLEERSTAQVAEDLGVSPDLVRWRLRTARERLRAHVSRSI
jgi:RNA polymerase sigma-70 factor (ECF subfamily)